MQNKNSDTDFGNLNMSTSEHISTLKSFFSSSEILNTCKDLMTSPKDKTIQIFLKEIHSQIIKIISPDTNDNDHKNLKEIPWVFYCIFNLLLNLLNTPGHYSLLEQISGLIELYFNFLEISEQEYGLCFVEENSDLLNLYISAHSGLPSANFQSIQISIIDIPDANKVGSRNELDNKNLTENLTQTEIESQRNLSEEVFQGNQSSVDKKSIQNLKLLSVDLLLVEILELFFAREDSKEHKEIAKSLEKLYETLSMNLLFYVVYIQSFNMALVNRLVGCAIESLKWLFKDKETQNLYLQSLRGPKIEYIEFFLQLLGLNLSDSPSNTVQLKIKIPIHMPLMYKSTKRTGRFRSVIIGNEAEVSFITDPLFRDPKDAVNMYKETILTYRDNIIWHTLEVNKLDTSQNLTSTKQDLDQLIAGVLVLIEGALQDGVPSTIKEQLLNDQEVDLFKLTHNVVVLLSSVEPLVKAIQIMIEIKQARKETDSQELWDNIELLSLEGPEKSLAIVEVIVATMKKSRSIRIFELGGRMKVNEAQITYLEELKKIVIRMGKEQQINIPTAVKVLEEIIMYISEMTNREFEELQEKVVEVMIEIYKVPLYVETLIFTDVLMNKFLQNFTCEPHSIIMVEFMKILYVKFVNEAEYFKHYGTQFFSKVKSFLDHMYKNITNANTHRSFQLISMNSSDFTSSAESPASRIAQPRKFSHETTDGFVNMFQLICSLIVGLINQEKTTDFIDQYGIRTMPDVSYDFNVYIFTAKSEHMQKYFATTGIFQEIVTCLSLNLLHTREIAYWFVQLTFCMVHQEHDIMTIFGELDHHIRFYDVLTKIYKKDRLLKQDVLKIINLLLNLASNNDYLLLFEDRVDDILSIPDVLKSLKEDPSTNTITYASLTNQNFIYVIFKMLFEWDLDLSIKLCYLRIVSRSLKFSFYNALICGQKLLVEYLLVCLRKEKNEEVKAKIAGLLTKILRNSSNVSQIKSLLRTVRFNYHELYPSFFEKLVSPPSRASFVQDMLDFDSYYRSIKLIFQKVIKKVLAETEDNGNFIHFSGQMSGIAVKNFNLETEKGFSIIAQFRFENLKSLNKRFLALDETSPSGQKILHRLSQQNSPGLSLFNHINEDYFKTPRSIPQGPYDFVETPNDKYLPCLFTIVSANNVEMSLYIGYHEKEKRRVMLLECKSLLKKGPQYRDIFDYPIEENQWYTLVFAFSPKSNVTIYLDGQECKPVYKTNFSTIFDSMNLEKTMIIGSSPATNEHKKENFNVETSFQGQVSNFLVYPFEISAQESSLVPRISNMDKIKNRRVSVMSFLKQAFDAKKKNTEHFDPAYLSQNSILDLNAFVKMTRLSVQKEIHWTTNAYSQPQSSKKKFGLFSGNAKDKPKASESLQIKSKGAFFIEKSKFEDVFFSVGNVDVFLLCIDLLAKVKIPHKESIQDMLCEIIDVIKLLASNSYQEDTLRFLDNNGVYVLGYLLQEFVNQHGGTVRIAENLISLLSSFSDIDIKYRGAQALFWKFYAWESCTPALQMEIYQKSLQLLTPDVNKGYFKKNGNIIIMLDYIYTKLHTIKRDPRILLLKPESEYEAEVKENAKFRTLLWQEIIKTVKAYYDPNTLHKELLGLCRYVASCKLDINLYDALSALVDIFRMFPRQVESEMLPYDKFQKILNDVKLRDLLSCIIMRCTKDQLIQSDENMSNTEADSLYITDKIISMTINLIGFAFFKVTTPSSSSKPSIPTIKSMSYEPSSSRSDVSLQPSTSPRVSNDKMLFLKLFNRCFVEKMSRESFDAFMEVAKFKGTSVQIYEDRHLLSLIVAKGWKLNNEVKELFLANLLNLFENPQNLQAFFKAPNFFNFVYSYLDSQLSGKEGNANEFGALQGLVTEVVQKSFIQLLKTKDGMLQIIRISHCKPTECLTYILKIYLKPVLELFEKSLIHDQNSEGPSQIQEIEKPEIILNLMHLLTYLSVWIANVKDAVINQDETEICAVVKLLFNMFFKLEILHSTMPNFKSNMSNLDHTEMIKRSQKRSLYRNGGIFFTMFRFLSKLLPRLSKPENKNFTIDLLSLLVLPYYIKKSKDTSEEKMKSVDLIQKMEASNTSFVKIMRSVFPFKEVEGYLELTNSEKNILTRPADHVIYGTILASLLHRILKDRKVKPSQLSQGDNSQNAEQIHIKLNLRLVKIVEGISGNAEKALRAAFPTFVQSIPSTKKLAFGKEVIKKGNCTFDVDPRSTSYNLGLIDEYYKQALSSFFQCLRSFEDQKRLVKQGQSSPSMHNKFSAFFTSLTDALEHGTKSMSIYKKFSNKPESNDSSKASRVSEFLTQSAPLITNQILPILKENCSLVFDISNQISKIYYDWNMISAHENERAFMEEFESFDKVDPLMKAIKETKEMAHQFQNGLETWTQTERRNINKITKKWNFHKKKLLQERGIWQVEESSSDLVRYKIDKAEDNYRRRMRLKKDIQAAKKEYINASEYQLRLKSSRTPSAAAESPYNRQLRIEDPLFNLDPQSDIISEYESSPNIMRLNTEDTLPPSPRKVEGTIGFSEIPKEEVLACIKEDAFSYLAPKEVASTQKWKHRCEKIALKGAVYGDIEITSSKYIIFSPTKEDRPNTTPYCFGAVKDSFIKLYTKKKQWPISNISQIHTRNYNLLPTAVEIFIKDDAKTYFFNLYYDTLRQEFIKRVKSLNNEIFVVVDRAKEFQRQDYERQWVEGHLTNFDYLMLINTYAGRSYNDINQYPVFPWVLKDYISQSIDLDTKDSEEQEKIFRPLHLPIGAINDKKRSDALEKFAGWDETDEPKFHYGSHYSNAGSIINFLIRLEPFTSLNMDLQSGKFDQADRLFRSVQSSWESCLECRGDFRELVPEFFFLPEVLKNYNNVDFGKTQTNKQVGDVELPGWAKTPEEFILKHREALECEYVSRHLHEWIDLIFGYKQRGLEAEKAMNVFRYLSYEGAVNLADIKDPKERAAKLEQIFHLGQTPTQIFTTPHQPKKISTKEKKDEDILSYIIQPLIPFGPARDLNFRFFDSIKASPVIHLSCDNTFLYVIYKDLEMYSIPYQPRTLIAEFKWSELKKRSITTKLGKIAPNEVNPRNQYTMLRYRTNQAKTTYHVIGGYIDHSIKIFKDGEVYQTYRFHKKIVTAVAAAFVPRIKQHFIVAGSKDCRITIWKFDPTKKDQKNDPEILYAHHNEITAVFLESSLGLIISADKDGVVLVFCAVSGKLFKTIKPSLTDDEYIKIIEADENGFILLVTSRDKVIVYTMNGSLLNSTEDYTFKHGLGINSVMFVNKFKPYIVLSTKMSNFVVFDFLRGHEVRNLTASLKPINKADQNNDEEDVMKIPISSIIVSENKKHLYLAFENGSLAILGKNMLEKELRQEFSEIGIGME